MARGSKQEHVDSLTMKIHNPNVRGSGYIEHPPQVPFGGRVVVQPSTVNDGDVPEWFSHAVPGQQQRVPGHYQTNRPQQQQQQAYSAPAPVHATIPEQVAPSGNPPAPQRASEQQPAPVEEKKLSKSAKAKLRKKMREGKI